MNWEDAKEALHFHGRIASRSLGHGYKTYVTPDDELLIVMCNIGGIGGGKIDLDTDGYPVTELVFGRQCDRDATDWEVV